MVWSLPLFLLYALTPAVYWAPFVSFDPWCMLSISAVYNRYCWCILYCPFCTRIWTVPNAPYWFLFLLMISTISYYFQLYSVDILMYAVPSDINRTIIIPDPIFTDVTALLIPTDSCPLLQSTLLISCAPYRSFLYLADLNRLLR